MDAPDGIVNINESEINILKYVSSKWFCSYLCPQVGKFSASCRLAPPQVTNYHTLSQTRLNKIQKFTQYASSSLQVIYFSNLLKSNLDTKRRSVSSLSKTPGVEVDVSANRNGNVVIDLLLEAYTCTEDVGSLVRSVKSGSNLALNGGVVVELSKCQSL